jgi:putative membrane protein
MQRELKDYITIGLKGIAMGAADAVPGVSGGTIALISGIYEELISSLSNINISLFKSLKTEGFKSFWKGLNGNFLLALGLGILISFVSFMHLAKYLIEQHHVLIWSFFFGLVIASIYFVGKQIKIWSTAAISGLIIGTLLAYYISTLPSLGSNTNTYFLFFAGAIAICAMILPGISGSFILVILGAYKTLSNAFYDFDIKKIIIFAFGALIGLLSFSKLLKWLFKNYENTTLALLTGFIIGSLNKIWPWKQTLSVFNETTGLETVFNEVSSLGTLAVMQKQTQNFDGYKAVIEECVLPQHYININQLTSADTIPAIGLMIAGFLTIFILEKVGQKV